MDKDLIIKLNNYLRKLEKRCSSNKIYLDSWDCKLSNISWGRNEALEEVIRELGTLLHEHFDSTRILLEFKGVYMTDTEHKKYLEDQKDKDHASSAL